MADSHDDDVEPADASPPPAAASESTPDADNREAATAGSHSPDPDSPDPNPETASGTAVAGEGPPDTDESVVEAVGDPDIEAVLGERRTLHGRVRYLWVLGRLVTALVIGAVLGFAVFRFEVVETVAAAVGVGGAAAAVVLLAAAVHAVFLYRSWHYVVRENSLYLTRGVFTVVQTVVPYVRVQHIDTRRSAFERALGLSSLVVYTAGSRGADVTIPGLTPERAETLQKRLKRLAIESEDEDAV